MFELTKSQKQIQKAARTAMEVGAQTIKGHMEGQDVICDTMMSKYASSESLNLMIDRALDMFGEYGRLEASPLVRTFRDVRVITIFAGHHRDHEDDYCQVNRPVKSCSTILL